MVQFHSPLFCSRCSYLALAELEDSALCLSCLLQELKTSNDPYLVYKITPLELSRSELKGLVKVNNYRKFSIHEHGVVGRLS